MAISIRSVTYNETTFPVTTLDVTTSESPSATQTGDLVVVIHANDFYTLANMPTPTATGSPTLTAVTGATADAGTDQAHIKCWTYVVNTGGAQTIAVSETGDAFEEKTLIAYVLAGADTSTPIDVAGNTTSAVNDDPWIIAAISPSTSDAFLIAHANRGASGDLGGLGGLTVPGSMTQRYNDIVGLGMGGATQQLSASGSTGTRTFDPGNSPGRPWAGVLIAVRTATAVVVPSIRVTSAARRLP